MAQHRFVRFLSLISVYLLQFDHCLSKVDGKLKLRKASGHLRGKKNIKDENEETVKGLRQLWLASMKDKSVRFHDIPVGLTSANTTNADKVMLFKIAKEKVCEDKAISYAEKHFGVRTHFKMRGDDDKALWIPAECKQIVDDYLARQVISQKKNKPNVEPAHLAKDRDTLGTFVAVIDEMTNFPSSTFGGGLPKKEVPILFETNKSRVPITPKQEVKRRSPTKRRRGGA